MRDTQERRESVAPPERGKGRRGIPVDILITLTAVIHPEDGGGYAAEVPALPGCLTEGETPEEVRANLREAAEGWLLAKQDLLASRAGLVP